MLSFLVPVLSPIQRSDVNDRQSDLMLGSTETRKEARKWLDPVAISLACEITEEIANEENEEEEENEEAERGRCLSLLSPLYLSPWAKGHGEW